MPQTIVSPRAGLAQLKQAAAADAAVRDYSESWGYADEGLLPGKKHYQRDYTACQLENDDYAERLGELVAAQSAVAAAAAAVAQYSSAMSYAAGGRSEHKAQGADWDSRLDMADFAEALEDLVHRAQGALSAAARASAAYNSAMAYAEPGSAEHKAGAAAPAPLDHADMAECLEELTRRFRACAAAGLPGGDAWQYAEAGRAEHKAGAGEAAEAMLSTADLAERLRELIAA